MSNRDEAKRTRAVDGPGGGLVSVQVVLDRETARELMRELREHRNHANPELFYPITDIASALEAALFRS